MPMPSAFTPSSEGWTILDGVPALEEFAQLALLRYPFTHSSTRQLTEASSMRVRLCVSPC
jgi:hypothetical protein